MGAFWAYPWRQKAASRRILPQKAGSSFKITPVFSGVEGTSGVTRRADVLTSRRISDCTTAGGDSASGGRMSPGKGSSRGEKQLASVSHTRVRAPRDAACLHPAGKM